MPRLPHRRVVVCLATYNGAKYLPQQLASLQGQTHRPDRIFIADDGSTDATPEIIAAFAKRDPDGVTLLPPGLRLGPAGNFSRCLSSAMELSDGDIFFCCDQDDVWAADKIAVCLQELARLAALHGEQHPLLVHHDLELIDTAGRSLGKTFWRTAAIDPYRATFRDLLVRNVVTGCAMAVNRPLLAQALPIPATAAMHDGWLALSAVALGGAIQPMRQTLVAYRQHGANAIGAPLASIWTRVFRRVLTRGRRESRWIFVASAQAREALYRFGPRLDKRDYQAAGAVARWDQASRYRRLRDAFAIGLVGHTPLRTLFLYAWLLLVTP